MHMQAMTTTPQELRIPPITVGVRLKLAREMAGYDQRELAAALGIATRSVQNYEHGNTQPKRPVLVVWAMTTGVPLSWLTEGEMPPRSCPSCGHEEVSPGMTCFLQCAQVSTPDAEEQPPARRSHLRSVPSPC